VIRDLTDLVAEAVSGKEAAALQAKAA
jgi:hypothetical protein